MKRLFTLCVVCLLMGSAFAQVLVNETFENGNTVGQSPVGWICSDNGWKVGITIPDDNEARGRKPHTGDWYMYATYNTDVWIYKEINVTAGNYYRVSFWYATWHVDHFDLEVKAGASASPSAMTITVVPQMIVENEDYEQTSGVFQATTTGTCYVGFHSMATNSPWYLSIDDVVIEQTAQYFFEVEQLTADTTVYFGEPAYLRFRLSNTGEQADTYQFANTGTLPVEFYQDGNQVNQVAVPYSSSVELVAKATLPMELTNGETLHATFNLTSSHSAPTQSADFKITAMEPFNAFPLMEGFEDDFVPSGWQNIITNGNYAFDRRTTSSTPNAMPHDESQYMARFYTYTNPEGGSAELVSPKMALSTTDNMVSFWIFRNMNPNINRPDRINVYYNTEPKSEGGELLGTVHRCTYMEPVVSDQDDWYEYSFSFNSPTGFGFIIFEGVSGYGWDLLIDDIIINSTNVDNNPPTVVSLSGAQTWAETDMHLRLRVYDASGMPSQLPATYTINGQQTDVTFYRTTKANYDYVAALPAQANHTSGSIVLHLVDELGNAADSEPYDLHWDWQAPILLEGFEGDQFPPAGWSRESINMSWFTWFRSSAVYADDWFGNEYYVVPPQGTKQAALEWDSSEEWGPQDEALVTPLISIERPSVLTFETFCLYGVVQYHDHYQVDVLNTNTGSWNTLWDAVDLPEYVNQYQEPVSLDLSPYQGNNIRLRFRGYNESMDVLTYSWFIDNVKVVATDTTEVSVGEVMLNDDVVSLYPNPAKDQVRINSKAKIRNIQIVGINGEMMENKEMDRTGSDLPLEGYAKGVYFIRLVTDEGVIVKKLIVQ